MVVLIVGHMHFVFTQPRQATVSSTFSCIWYLASGIASGLSSLLAVIAVLQALVDAKVCYLLVACAFIMGNIGIQ
jgi:hypothetical protein